MSQFEIRDVDIFTRELATVGDPFCGCEKAAVTVDLGVWLHWLKLTRTLVKLWLLAV